MRITFLTQWFQPEPAATHGLPLAKRFAERGHQVEVVTGFPNYPGGKIYPGYRIELVHREVIDNVLVTRVPLYPSHDRSGARRFATYASLGLTSATIGLALAKPADVLYVYHPPATLGLGADMWRTIRRTPFVYHIADMWPESVTESGMIGREWMRRGADRVLTRWCNRVYRRAARISVLSPGFKRLLVERGVPREKVSVVYHWADESLFFPAPRDEPLAKGLEIERGFNIVYAGNLGHYQCLDTAIRAAGALQALPGFRLVLVGTGPAESDLRALAHSLGAENVKFVDRRPESEMNSVCSLADAMLVSLKDLPFFTATVPSKTQVALATGRPVVMAVRGDAARLVEESGAGVVCDPENEAALADAFRRMFEMDESERESMGQRGREFYVRELSFDRGATEIERLLKQAASLNRSGAEVKPFRG